MGEGKMPLFRPRFNGSVVVEARPERLTAEPGALVIREMLDHMGLVEFLSERIEDPRNPDLITHPLSELIRSGLILLAQGWRDQDDADALRDDPALRLSVSDRRGVAPLEMRAREEGVMLDKNPEVPDGLASQPTMSRLQSLMSSKGHREVLGEGLLEGAAQRARRQRRGHRMRYATLDVDSFPIDSYGHQSGACYNGYYHRVVFHPLVAHLAETGDIVGARLRAGNVHTASEAAEFIHEMIIGVESKICQVAAVRMDAGFPEEGLLASLEGRGTPYVARLKTNEVLERLAAPYVKRPIGRRTIEPRTWLYELTYQAKEWEQARRIVLVVQERPDDLFLHHFFLVTNFSIEQMSGEELLEFYRQRGNAENFIGELKSVLAPALSSAVRRKRHYRGRELHEQTESVDSFAVNEVRFLLNALAFNVLNGVRQLLARATRQGWSLQRLRERVLRTAARVVVHARRAVFVIDQAHARYWSLLCAKLARLDAAWVT
jgi:hypothetical protein